jgi:hypothetical protein
VGDERVIKSLPPRWGSPISITNSGLNLENAFFDCRPKIGNVRYGISAVVGSLMIDDSEGIKLKASNGFSTISLGVVEVGMSAER